MLQGVKSEFSAMYSLYNERSNGFVTSWSRNCLLKHVIEGEREGRIEASERRGKRGEQVLLP
jgi:hypothetical protein